jgi:hypothetical protein
LPALTLFAMARREVGSSCSGPTCPGCVSFPGCVLPSRPSPCGGLSPPLSTMLDKTPQPHTAGFPCDSTPPPAWSPRSLWGLPSFSTPLFLYATACGLRRTFPSSPTRMVLYCLRCALKPSASATSAFSKRSQHFRACPGRDPGGRGSPYGLQDTLSTPRPSCSPCHHGSAMDVRLDTGGWLPLTRQGLSPCKKRQAFLAQQR